MTAKNKRSSGRVTPKGTKNPTKTAKPKPEGMPDVAPGAPPHELAGKAGKQSGKVIRPMTHNRGNR